MLQSIDGESDVTNEASTSSEDSPKQKRSQRNRKTNHQHFVKQRSSRNNQGSKMMNYHHAQVQTVKTYEKFEQHRYRALEPPLRQHTKLNLTEAQLVQYLKHYLLDETLMRLLGFPIEYDLAPNLTIIYKYPPYEFISQRKQSTQSSTTYYSNSPIIVNSTLR